MWANDNKHVFYSTYDEAWRPYQLWLHELGTEQSEDVLVFEEADLKFRMGASRSLSDQYILLHIGSAVTDEVWYANADEISKEDARNKKLFKCIAPRVQNVEYAVTHHEKEFLILTNDDDCMNFKLMSVPCDIVDGDKSQWREVIPHSEDVTLVCLIYALYCTDCTDCTVYYASMASSTV